MLLSEWIVWSSIETVKYFLVIYGILGFQVKKTRIKYIVFLYLLLGIPLVNYNHWDPIFFKTAWIFIFTETFFDNTINKKFRAAMLSYFVIDFLDMLVWSVYINVPISSSNIIVEKLICNLIGASVWLVLACFLRYKKRIVNKIFSDMSAKMFIALLMLVFGMAIMAACVQFSLLDDISDRVRKIAMFGEMICLFWVVTGCIVFVYMVYSKKQMQYEKKMDMLLYDRKNRYYEQIIRKNENIKAFHHDLQKHIRIINTFCEKQDITSIQNYIYDITKCIQNNKIVDTGNEIVNCFIDYMIEGMKEDLQFHYEIKGCFPPDLKMTDKDICVLFANAIENAQNTLKSIQGEKYFAMEIKHYREKIFVTISNTAQEDALAQVNKKESGHYGIRNMKSVVENYNGKIHFTYKDKMFTVEIDI